MRSLPPSVEADTAEILALVESLHQTERRLHLLTGGEVDSILDSQGRTFLFSRTQESLRHTEAVKQAAILNALTAHIALLDARGVVVSVNDAWRSYGRDNQLHSSTDAVGENYITVCDQARGPESAQAREVSAGIRAVLCGASNRYSLEYPCHSDTVRCWFKLVVTPLVIGKPNGAVVMHVDVTQDVETQARLRESELRFRQMAENIHDVFFLRSIDGSEIQYLSPAYERIWGRSRASAYANPESLWGTVHPDDRAGLAATIRRNGSSGVNIDYRLIRPDAEVRWINVRSFPVFDELGEPYRMAGIARDITARKETQRKIERLSRVSAMLGRINSLIVHATDRNELFTRACQIAVEAGGFKMAWIGVIDPQTLDGGVVAWAGGEESYTTQIRLTARAGTADSEWPACRALHLSQPVICNDIATDPSLHYLRSELLRRGHKAAASFPLVIAGRPAAVLALFAGEPHVFDAEETGLLLELAGDISFALDHLAKAEQLNYVAYYDALTGLANRRLFLDRVALHARGAVNRGCKMALCVIDLERFKSINDSFGQASGDLLLKQVAQWLTERLGDASVLARVGADKFAVILPEVQHEAAVARLLEVATSAFLLQPFTLGDRTFRIAAKVGVALLPDDAETADTLFANAESALKKAKVTGDRLLFYSRKMTETVSVRLSLEFRLRQALDNQEFVLHYQPKVNLLSGKLTGAEALIRWNDPQSGMVPPGQFIAVLEETGLILEVGRWALQKAVDDYLRWRDAGLDELRIAVNVSPIQLRHRDFISTVLQTIGTDPRASSGLELEITESLVMEDVKHSIVSLKSLRDMGVRIAIDDFGTGFSSLSYLAKLPVDTLKIDRSFVAEMVVGADGLSLVSAIIGLGHSLRLNIVAEGVETEEQARALRLLRCDEMQGFLFGAPVPADAFASKYLMPPPER